MHAFEYDFRAKVGQEAWVVVVIYQSGGTFDISYGNSHVEGVYKTREKAEKVAELITDDDNHYRKMRWQGTWSEYKPKYTKSAVWHGHFERLEEVKVIKFVIE